MKPGQEGVLARVVKHPKGYYDLFLGELNLGELNQWGSDQEKDDLEECAAKINTELTPLLTELEALRADAKEQRKKYAGLLAVKESNDAYCREKMSELEALRACVKAGEGMEVAIESLIPMIRSEYPATVKICSAVLEAYSLAKKSLPKPEGGEGE